MGRLCVGPVEIQWRSHWGQACVPAGKAHSFAGLTGATLQILTFHRSKSARLAVGAGDCAILAVELRTEQMEWRATFESLLFLEPGRAPASACCECPRWQGPTCRRHHRPGLAPLQVLYTNFTPGAGGGCSPCRSPCLAGMTCTRFRTLPLQRHVSHGGQYQPSTPASSAARIHVY